MGVQSLLDEEAPFVQGWSLPIESLHLIYSLANSLSLAPLGLAYWPVIPKPLVDGYYLT